MDDQTAPPFQVAAELTANHRCRRWFMRSRSTDGRTASAEFSPHNPSLNGSTDATQDADSDGTSGWVTEFASELRPKQGEDSHHYEHRS